MIGVRVVKTLERVCCRHAWALDKQLWREKGTYHVCLNAIDSPCWLEQSAVLPGYGMKALAVSPQPHFKIAQYFSMHIGSWQYFEILQ